MADQFHALLPCRDAPNFYGSIPKSGNHEIPFGAESGGIDFFLPCFDGLPFFACGGIPELEASSRHIRNDPCSIRRYSAPVETSFSLFLDDKALVSAARIPQSQRPIFRGRND